MMDAPEGELLVEERWEDYARRVHRDGGVWELTGVAARFEDGEWHFDSQPLVWRTVVTLGSEAVSSLEEAIRGAGVLFGPARIEPEGTVSDPRVVTWTFELDGRRHMVEVLIGAEQPEPFASLDRTIQLAVAEALDRGI
jgi:hypothetical protein